MTGRLSCSGLPVPPPGGPQPAPRCRAAAAASGRATRTSVPGRLGVPVALGPSPVRTGGKHRHVPGPGCDRAGGRPDPETVGVGGGGDRGRRAVLERLNAHRRDPVGEEATGPADAARRPRGGSARMTDSSCMPSSPQIAATATALSTTLAPATPMSLESPRRPRRRRSRRRPRARSRSPRPTQTPLPGRQARGGDQEQHDGGEDPSQPAPRPPSRSTMPPTHERRRCHVASPPERPGTCLSEQAARRAEQVEVDPEGRQHTDEDEGPAPGVL